MEAPNAKWLMYAALFVLFLSQKGFHNIYRALNFINWRIVIYCHAFIENIPQPASVGNLCQVF